jgi:hypothetical protein
VVISAPKEQTERMDATTCPVCGTDSLVTVVSSGQEGELRQFCNECARRRLWNERRGVRQIASGSARLLIYAGVILTVLTISVNQLSISGNTVFGWRQITGAEVGFLCIVLGLLVARGWLGMTGLFLLIVSLGADLLRLGHAPGLGWRKQTALGVAGVLVVGGILWQRALKKRAASLPVDADEGAQG